MAFLSTLSSLILLQWLGARVKVSVRKKINIGFHLLGQSNIHKNTWKTTHLIRRNGNFPIAHFVVRHRSNYFIDPKYKCLRPRSDVIECIKSQNRINAAKWKSFPMSLIQRIDLKKVSESICCHSIFGRLTAHQKWNVHKNHVSGPKPDNPNKQYFWKWFHWHCGTPAASHLHSAHSGLFLEKKNRSIVASVKFWCQFWYSNFH